MVLDPQTMALPPGLHLFERDWLSSNGVLLVDRESATLIDSGYVKHAAMTEALVARVLGPRSLDRVINTHLHSDHCGGNARLRNAWGCQIVVPQASVATPLSRMLAWCQGPPLDWVAWVGR